MQYAHKFVLILFLLLNVTKAQNIKFDVSNISPRVTSSFLLDSWFLNDSTGYIGGSKGTVLFTNDYGETWKSCPTPKNILIESLFFFDSINGWAAGGDYNQLYLINTSDGGQTWTEHNISALAGKEINKIYFQTRSIGWITGGSVNGGFVFRTEDGGKTWVDRSPNDLEIPHHVICDITTTSLNMILICGFRGYLASSNDNGKTWQRITCKSIAPDSLISGPLERFQQVDNNVLYCKGKEDILKSEDGGKNWKAVFYIGSHGYLQLGGFYFNSAKEGFTYGGLHGAPSFFKFTTTDGGNSWLTTKDSLVDFLGNICFPENNKQGYIIGREPNIVRISSLGESKVQLNNGYTSNSIPSVGFYNNTNGYIGGAAPLGLRITNDAGISWHIVDSTADYTGLIQKDQLHLARNNGMVTIDGGKTWHQASDNLGDDRIFYNSINYDAVYFTQKQDKSTKLYVTKNWFSTSEECAVPDSSGTWTFFFTSSDVGWAANTHLYKTTDGAHSWKQISQIEEVFGAKCIFFIDDLHGWIGGVSNVDRKTTIVHTKDGGQTWIVQKDIKYSPDSLYASNTRKRERLPERICAYNHNEAWFSTDFVGVFYTVNGGITWQQITLPQEFSHFTNGGTIALAGNGSLFCAVTDGTIIKISKKNDMHLRLNQSKVVFRKQVKYKLQLPLELFRGNNVTLFELNGSCIKMKDMKYQKRFRRPLIIQK